MASRTDPDTEAAERSSTGNRRGGARSDNEGMKAATQVVKAEMAELTGRRVDAVTAAERQDGGWRMTLEMVELERIPASTSVMGSYDVVADGDGHVLEYGRTHRYYHNRADETDTT